MRRLLVAVALLAATSCSKDDPEPLAVAEVPSTYRITYRIVDGGEVSSERLTVDRPFASRLETFASDDGTGAPETVEIARLGRSSRQGARGAGRLAVAIPPAVAPNDTRIEHALGTDVLERGRRKTIAGRDCQVYRTGQSLRLVELVPERDGTRVEVCVDAAGLILEERTRDRTRRAIEVEIDVRVTRDELNVGERTIPVLDGGGAVQEVTTGSRTPDRFWELGDDLPLPHTGRYAVVPPQPEAFTDATLRGRQMATTTDVLSDGIDVVVVDRGGTLGGLDIMGDDEGGEEVDLDELGTGILLRTAVGAEITVVLGEGRFVRISGTLPPDDLVAVGRAMHEVEGGNLTPIGESW